MTQKKGYLLYIRQKAGIANEFMTNLERRFGIDLFKLYTNHAAVIANAQAD